jgi:Cu+-exporting ATPase
VGNLALLREQGIVPEQAYDGANIHVAADGRYLGGLQVADVVRPEAGAAIRQLKAMGLHLVLLTGDAAAVAKTIGAELGFENVIADLLPEEKMAEIKRLQASGRKVAMVGDGINDAPALAEALVGIGMGSGTEIAREAADVVLLGNDLLKLVETLRIARRCRAIIMQNFVGTLVVDVVGVATRGAEHPEPPPRGVHPRDIRAGVHLELDEAAAGLDEGSSNARVTPSGSRRAGPPRSGRDPARALIDRATGIGSL